MAEVYLADDTELGRPVALKVLPADDRTDPQARSRLLREARAAATLDHPHICSVYEIGESDGHRFIAMQYIEGEPLDARLRRSSIELQETLTIALGVADALADAHAHGVIHRDIKPSNVIITSRGQPKVLDFGLAKLVREPAAVQTEVATEAPLSGPGTVLGTVPYMSPEQVRGETLDGRSDIFSLGVMLYEMVSGQRPFADKTSAATAAAILTREPQPLARFSPDVPAELERIVGKTLRKDPNERYQTAKDLLLDLRALRDEGEFQRRFERSGPPAERSSPETPRPSSAGAAPGIVGARTMSSRSPAWMQRGATAVVVLGVVAGAGWFVWQRVNARRAEALIPQIEALAQAGKYFEAYDLAMNAEPYLTGNSTLARLMPTISNPISAVTRPSGANVYLTRFAPDTAGNFPPRQLAGTTPLTNLRAARGEYILAIEKDGYAPTERTVSGVLMQSWNATVPPPPITVDATLVARDQMPARMVSVPGSDYRLVAFSRPTDRRVRLNDFFIDKYEVSNQEYKDFINAGGYLKKQFWKYPFIKDGRTISWEEGLKALTDRTGLPGPRSWTSQNFPDGKASYPATDISWYKASAYAAFRGKELPTVFQWEKAARNGAVHDLVNYMPWGVFYPGDTLAHHANFGSNGTLPVESSPFGMSPFGSYNMAGNVSEWTLTDTSEGFLAAGGAWGEPPYVFAEYGRRPGFYSSNRLGFRCVQNTAGSSGDQGAARIEIAQEIPVYKPSSQASFNAWREAYRYEKTTLDARVEEVKETPEWRRERITFKGANGERAIAYLYLPNHVARPLQILHVVPGGDVEYGLRDLPTSMESLLGPFIKAGRAAFGVVLKGYIERLTPGSQVPPSPTTVEYLEQIVNRITDLRRGLDYLESRSDVDMSRVAFVGPSAGAQIGLIAGAIETRYRTVVLIGSGLTSEYLPYIAEANPINFVPHIRGPKLMVQGRYDEDRALKTGAEPLFRLLSEPKRMELFEGGHMPAIEQLMSATSGWLDETLGVVRRE